MFWQRIEHKMNQLTRATKRASGFSLPEMMIVLVIMGIVLSMAVPNFVRIGRRDAVEAAAYDIQRVLSVTRQKALAKRALYKVVFDTGNRRVSVFRKSAGAWVSDTAPDVEWREDLSLSLLVGGSAGNLDVVLEPQGTVASSDAPAEFTFTNCHGDSSRINMVRTGRIRVHL
jgi:type II secretion system protein H